MVIFSFRIYINSDFTKKIENKGHPLKGAKSRKISLLDKERCFQVKSGAFLSWLMKLTPPDPSALNPNPLDSKSNLLINKHSDLYRYLHKKDLKDAGNDC
jgi:hypothetical protein